LIAIERRFTVSYIEWKVKRNGLKSRFQKNLVSASCFIETAHFVLCYKYLFFAVSSAVSSETEFPDSEKLLKSSSCRFIHFETEFLSGENPDDVRMRWIKLCEEMEIPKEQADNVYWIAGRFSLKDTHKQVAAEAAAHGPFNLVSIDSAAAFYEGDDENSNTQFGKYAGVELRAMA
jgi:hypothetical protein